MAQMSGKEMAELAVRALDSKKGKAIKVLETGELTTLAEYFVLCTGTSNTQIKALADAVEEATTSRATGTVPGSLWTTRRWWSISSPRRRGSSMTWSGCGKTRRTWTSPLCWFRIDV